MLTISKPLSAAQAHSYHQQEFSNSQDNYYTEGEKFGASGTASWRNSGA